VRLGGEVDDGVDLFGTERLLRTQAIADVALHEHDPIFDVGQIRSVAGIGEDVVGDDVIFRDAAPPSSGRSSTR